MIKYLKTTLVILLVFVGLTITAPVFAVDTDVKTATASQAVETQTQLPSRMPTGKRELAYKFVMAMLGVGASSVIIYVLLTIYNRFIYGTPHKFQEKTEDDDYKTPTNMKDAINIFLKKTK